MTATGKKALIGVVAFVALAVAGYAALRLAWTRAAGSLTPAIGADTAPTRDGTSTKHRATPAAVEAILSSAQSYRRQGELGKANAVLAGAVREYADEQALRLEYATLLVEHRQTDAAYEQYVAALAIGPRALEIEFAAGTVANMAGKPDRALEHYQAAQTADKTNPTYALYLAQIQLKLDQADAAKASLLRAANLDPNLAGAWGTLAEVALRENNISLALQHVAKARKLEPVSLAWRLVECRALARSGDPAKGVDLLVGLPDAQRFQSAVLQQIGECYGLLSHPADAAAVYAKASDASPANADLAYETARWFERAKDTPKAKKFAERAAGLGNKPAAELVTRLTK